MNGWTNVLIHFPLLEQTFIKHTELYVSAPVVGNENSNVQHLNTGTLPYIAPDHQFTKAIFNVTLFLLGQSNLSFLNSSF